MFWNCYAFKAKLTLTFISCWRVTGKSPFSIEFLQVVKELVSWNGNCWRFLCGVANYGVFSVSCSMKQLGLRKLGFWNSWKTTCIAAVKYIYHGSARDCYRPTAFYECEEGLERIWKQRYKSLSIENNSKCRLNLPAFKTNNISSNFCISLLFPW